MTHITPLVFMLSFMTIASGECLIAMQPTPQTPHPPRKTGCMSSVSSKKTNPIELSQALLTIITLTSSLTKTNIPLFTDHLNRLKIFLPNLTKELCEFPGNGYEEYFAQWKTLVIEAINTYLASTKKT